jgi:tRNA pseudouridine55 synthase
VLVLAVGEATKLVPFLTLDDKTYTGTIAFGEETDSLDAAGVVTRSAEVPPLTTDLIRSRAQTFLGKHLQRAPVISAIKQGGVPLHERVRNGEVVEAPEREVELFSVEIQLDDPRHASFRLHVAKGFYVRSFARDLAYALGTVGHLTSLQRTQSGAFLLSDCIQGDLLRQRLPGDAMSQAEARMRPLLTALAGSMKRFALSEEEALRVRQGKLLVHAQVSELAEEERCMLVLGTTPVAIAERIGESMRVVRGFAPENEDAA